MRKGIGEDGKVVAVIGDGALTGGVAYEALHQRRRAADADGDRPQRQRHVDLAQRRRDLALLPTRRLNPRLYQARSTTEERLTQLPLGLGRRIEQLGPEVKAAIKAYWAPGLFFEELDLAYMGVIDGHDVRRAPGRPEQGPRGPTGRSWSTSTPSRARASSPRRRAASRGWRSGTPPSPASSSTDARAQEAAPDNPSRPVSESDSPEKIEKLEKPPPKGPPQYTAVFAGRAGRGRPGEIRGWSASPPRWPEAPAQQAL